MKYNYLLIALMGLFLISFASASSLIYEPTATTNPNTFIKDGFNPSFGIIKISNTFLWIELDKIAEYVITTKTESIIDIGMEGRATLYQTGTLFDDLKFKNTAGGITTLQSGEYYIKVQRDNFVDVADRIDEVCKNETNNQTLKLEWICRDVYTYKSVNQPTMEWVRYAGQPLSTGDYYWKFEGERKMKQMVDIIPNKDGHDFNQWTWFNVTWNIKREISFNGTIGNNWTQVFNITGSVNMSSDFGDIRFINHNQTGELGYRLVSYVSGASAIFHVRLYNNDSIFLYYQNTSYVNTTSSLLWRDVYKWGDSFDDSNVVNITNGGGQLSKGPGTLVSRGVTGATTSLWFFTNNITYENYTIYTSAKSQADLRVVFRFNNANKEMFNFVLDPVYAINKAVFYYFSTWPTTIGENDQTTSYANTVNTYYNLSVIVNGTDQLFYVNDVNIKNKSRTENDAVGNTAGMSTYGTNVNVTTNWYYILPHLSVEPVYYFSSEEQGCSSEFLNTTLSEWINESCVSGQMNQTRFKIEYNPTDCYPNVTWWESVLVGPTWINTTFTPFINESCIGNNMNVTRNKTAYDLYSCSANITYWDTSLQGPLLFNTTITPFVNNTCVGDRMNISRHFTEYDLYTCKTNVTHWDTYLDGPIWLTIGSSTNWTLMNNTCDRINGLWTYGLFTNQTDVYGCAANFTGYQYQQQSCAKKVAGINFFDWWNGDVWGNMTLGIAGAILLYLFICIIGRMGIYLTIQIMLIILFAFSTIVFGIIAYVPIFIFVMFYFARQVVTAIAGGR